MKKLILIIILTALTLPGLVFALDPTDCQADTLSCLCPPIGSNLVDQSSINGDDPRRKCDEVCTVLSEEKTVSQWQLQCLVEPYGISNVGTGQLGSTVSIVHDIEEAAKEQLKAAIVPELGVDIPGLEFSDVTKESVIIDGEPAKVVSSNFIGVYVEAIYAYLISVGAIIAVIMLMVGGMEWMLARGNETKLGKAKTRIKNALIGMVLLLSAFTIAYLIDPNTVIFENLNIQYVDRIDFIGNETPFDMPITGSPVVSSEAAEGGVGWNGFLIFDQTQFGNIPYGPNTPKCFIPPSSKSNGSGNIRSSGCGVAAFAGVISTLGEHTTPDVVAKAFWEEGKDLKQPFRPIDSQGCGKDGTHPDAFVKSSFLEKNNLVGERIKGVWSNTGKGPSEEAKRKILEEVVAGNPVIVSYYTKPGPPPKGGHYVVLVGYEGENLLINNPQGGTKEKKNAKTFLTLVKTATVIKKK